MPIPRPFILVVLAALACGAAPAPEVARPSLCISSGILGYVPESGGQWRTSRFAERRYILRPLTDEDRDGYTMFLKPVRDPPSIGLFDFGTGHLAGWCSLHNPSFVKPALICSGYFGDLAVDLGSGRYQRYFRGGFISGDAEDGAVTVELGRCTRI